jgi:hypothetical protein
VTVDVDKAKIRYSPTDNGVGYNFSKVEEYQQEYLAGHQSVRTVNTARALEHLRKADELIRTQPDWTESE